MFVVALNFRNRGVAFRITGTVVVKEEEEEDLREILLMYFGLSRKMLWVTLHVSRIFVLQHAIYRDGDVFCLHKLRQKIRQCLHLSDLAHQYTNVFESEVNSVEIQMCLPSALS